jgi:hypothetical protein
MAMMIFTVDEPKSTYAAPTVIPVRISRAISVSRYGREGVRSVMRLFAHENPS